MVFSNPKPAAAPCDFDAAIYGAGFVGRSLALLLAQQGLRVALITPSVSQRSDSSTTTTLAEQGLLPLATEGHTDVRAFALNRTSRQLLEGIGAWPSDSCVTAIKSMRVYGDAGGELVLEGANACPDGTLAWMVDVPILAQTLMHQVTHESRIVCLTQTQATQAKLHAPVHVICEGGRASPMAQKLGINFQTIPYPQRALAARLICEHPHLNIARQWFSGQGDVLALLPMQGHEAHEVALVWSLSTAQSKQWLDAPKAAFCVGLQEACGHALGTMQLTTSIASWPLQLTHANPWCGAWLDAGAQPSSWVIAGDTAHTMHPLAGQGLNAGLGDVLELAQVFRRIQGHAPLFRPTQTQVQRALQSYARARQAKVLPVARVSDSLHVLFAHTASWAGVLRNAGMSCLNRAPQIKKLLIQQAQ